MASIQHLDDGAWQVRWREGAESRSKRFRRRVDADNYRIDLEHNLKTGEHVPIAAGKTTVGDWWATWFELQSQWSDGTRERQLIMWTKHIEPTLGRMEIAQVRNSTLQGVIARSGLAPATTKLLRSVLVSMFAGAKGERLISRSPAEGLRVAKDDVAEARPLSDDESTALVDACTPWERGWVLTGLGTGVRISEGLAIRKERVDFLRKQIHVRDQARTPQTGPVVLASLKNNRPRVVPLSESLSFVLSRHIDKFGTGSNGMLFPGPDGELLRRQTANNRFNAIVDRAGLDDGITWHNLRDTAATNMLRDGINPSFVAKVIGNTVPVLLERYAGVLPDDTERARTSLERITSRLSA